MPVSVATAERPAAARAAELRAIFASEAAFRAFYEAALPRIYGYLLNRCGDAALAEELTQLAFTAAVREGDRYDGEAEPITWITGIARHKLVDHFRKQEREEWRFRRLAVREIAADRDIGAWSAAEERGHLTTALAALPAAQRAALVLHYADGIAVREVARLLHRSESATESLLTRGRVGLRAAYGEVDR